MAAPEDTSKRPDEVRLLADAAIRNSEIIGGDIKFEVSLIGILTALQTSVAAGFAETKETMAGKADKADVESLRSEMRAVVGRLGDVEAWRTSVEHRSGSATAHLALAWKIAAALFGAATTVMLVLATAGAFHL